MIFDHSDFSVCLNADLISSIDRRHPSQMFVNGLSLHRFVHFVFMDISLPSLNMDTNRGL